jgi:hypothetical protein
MEGRKVMESEQKLAGRTVRFENNKVKPYTYAIILDGAVPQVRKYWKKKEAKKAFKKLRDQGYRAKLLEVL